MVDFSFIVSLYVSDLPNVTISTVLVPYTKCGTRPQQLLSLIGTRTVPTMIDGTSNGSTRGTWMWIDNDDGCGSIDMAQVDAMAQVVG